MAQRKEGHSVLFVEIPAGLKERLKVVAKRNHRSMVGEAVEAIERHVAAEEPSLIASAPPAPGDGAKKAKAKKKGGG